VGGGKNPNSMSGGAWNKSGTKEKSLHWKGGGKKYVSSSPHREKKKKKGSAETVGQNHETRERKNQKWGDLFGWGCTICSIWAKRGLNAEVKKLPEKREWDRNVRGGVSCPLRGIVSGWSKRSGEGKRVKG